MLTFIKLGGSLITDKRVQSAFRADLMARLAQEIKASLDAAPDLRLLIGHGSGSFGHFVAQQHGTIDGVQTPEQWYGFAEVATAAAELNFLIAHELHTAGVPIWRIQPSASAICHDGKLHNMALPSIHAAIEHGLVPLVYGDVALDEVRGGTIISTEAILSFLARHFPVQRLILFGEVEGVYDTNGQLVPQITPANLDSIADALSGSSGVDVTGGMLAKVRDMLALVKDVPGLTVSIINGTQPGLLQQTLIGQAQPGTLIKND